MGKLSVYEKHYKDLSEVWHHHYDDQTYIHEAIMLLHGCLVEMHSDIIQFEQKNGPEKTEKAKQRLVVLQENIQKVSALQSDNYALKHHNKNLVLRNMHLEKIVSEIHKQERNSSQI